MAKKASNTTMKPATPPSAVRASISFPPDVYENLEVIAKQKKVSLAWVVREAAEQYLADKWPLFSKEVVGERK
jgi:predicted DNA-binding protein